MLKAFRAVSILEGISYLIILSVTLGFITRDFVSVLGMAHGVLFMLYLSMSLSLTNSKGWSVMIWVLLLIASLVPFAFIPVEYFMKKAQENEVALPETSA
jgi:integral membrane protein